MTKNERLFRVKLGRPATRRTEFGTEYEAIVPIKNTVHYTISTSLTEALRKVRRYIKESEDLPDRAKVDSVTEMRGVVI